MIDYESWNFRQLQMECKRLNIPGNGTRAELLEKLQNSQTEFNPTEDEIDAMMEGGEEAILTTEPPQESEEKAPVQRIRVTRIDNTQMVRVEVPFSDPFDDVDEQRLIVRDKVIEYGYQPLGGLYAARFRGVGPDYYIYEMEVK